MSKNANKLSDFAILKSLFEQRLIGIKEYEKQMSKLYKNVDFETNKEKVMTNEQIKKFLAKSIEMSQKESDPDVKFLILKSSIISLIAAIDEDTGKKNTAPVYRGQILDCKGVQNVSN